MKRTLAQNLNERERRGGWKVWKVWREWGKPTQFWSLRRGKVQRSRFIPIVGHTTWVKGYRFHIVESISFIINVFYAREETPLSSSSATASAHQAVIIERISLEVTCGPFRAIPSFSSDCWNSKLIVAFINDPHFCRRKYHCFQNEEVYFTKNIEDVYEETVS